MSFLLCCGKVPYLCKHIFEKISDLKKFFRNCEVHKMAIYQQYQCIFI